MIDMQRPVSTSVVDNKMFNIKVKLIIFLNQQHYKAKYFVPVDAR